MTLSARFALVLALWLATAQAATPAKAPAKAPPALPATPQSAPVQPAPALPAPPQAQPQTQPALPQEQPLLRAPVLTLSLDEAVARVRREHPQVEVVGASTRDRASGAVHEVKVLTAKGKLRVIRYDAASGRRLDQ